MYVSISSVCVCVAVQYHVKYSNFLIAARESLDALV